MENRVFDEDETEHSRPESKAASEASSSDVTKEEGDSSADPDVLSRANSAVKMGLDILDDAFDEVMKVLEYS